MERLSQRRSGYIYFHPATTTPVQAEVSPEIKGNYNNLKKRIFVSFSKRYRSVTVGVVRGSGRRRRRRWCGEFPFCPVWRDLYLTDVHSHSGETKSSALGINQYSQVSLLCRLSEASVRSASAPCLKSSFARPHSLL